LAAQVSRRLTGRASVIRFGVGSHPPQWVRRRATTLRARGMWISGPTAHRARGYREARTDLRPMGQSELHAAVGFTSRLTCPRHERWKSISGWTQVLSIGDDLLYHLSVVILHRDIFAGVIRHERSRHQAYRRASSDVDGNRVARMIGGEQGCCDEGCGAASDHRGKLSSVRLKLE